MNRRVQFVIAAGAGVLAGVIAAWLMRPARPGEVPAPPPIIADASAAAVVRPEVIHDHAQALPSGVQGEPEPALPETAPTADSVIRGVVTWQEGSPCAGLNLAASLVDLGVLGLYEPERRGFADKLEHLRGRVASLERDTLYARTDGAGRFEFSGVGQSIYRLASDDRSIEIMGWPPRAQTAT